MRMEIEILKETISQLCLEMEKLKQTVEKSTKSRENELEGVSRDAEEPQSPTMTSQGLTSDAKQPKTSKTKKPTSERLSTVSTVLGGPKKMKILVNSNKEKTLSFADAVKKATSAAATSPLVSSGQPNPLLNSDSQPTSQQPKAWTEVKSKSKEKSSIKATSQPPSSLRSSLDRATKEETLKSLLRVPKPPEERSSEIVILSATLPLTRKAQVQPMVSWKRALKTLTGQLPLTISLINPFRAELFYDSSRASEVREVLREKRYLIEETQELCEKDLVRRKGAYLDGYFLPLRRAALVGFDPVQQLKILDLASDCLEKRFGDRLMVRQWKHQIAKDRLAIGSERSSMVA
jgi:hypothetical protein